MEALNERINTLISTLGIRKTAVADRLNVSQAFVSQLCTGKTNPSDRTISDICREFNVNEEWLRTGEGEMFKPKSRNEELQEFLLRSVDDPSGIQVKLLSVMARLSTDQWELLRDIALQIAEEVQKEKADP